MEHLTTRDMELIEEVATKAAKKAAAETVDKALTEFYASVGKGIFTKFLVWIGALVVGFAVGHGWLKLP